jgi:hypothetical protein
MLEFAAIAAVVSLITAAKPLYRVAAVAARTLCNVSAGDR